MTLWYLLVVSWNHLLIWSWHSLLVGSCINLFIWSWIIWKFISIRTLPESRCGCNFLQFLSNLKLLQLFPHHLTFLPLKRIYFLFILHFLPQLIHLPFKPIILFLNNLFINPNLITIQQIFFFLNFQFMIFLLYFANNNLISLYYFLILFLFLLINLFL